MQPRVTIGIVTYNSLHDLPMCFDALHRQTYPHLDVIVLDNASDDGSVAWLRANAPDITLILNTKNIGYARAHNQIIQAASLQSGEFYLALNPDVQLMPDYIACLVYLSGENRRLYSVGHGLRRGGYAVNIGYQQEDRGQFAQDREVFGAPGAAALYCADLIRALARDGDFFEEAMFMYGEDVDVDWRARRQGWQCWYVAAAVAYHRGSHPDDTLRGQAIANRYLSVVKNAYLPDLVCFNLPLMGMHCLFRLLLTPASGWQLIFILVHHAPIMWRKRVPPTIPRREFVQWFKWSRQQPSGQQQSILGRGFMFFKQRSSKKFS
jgi:GT2 family glycosyltransferase